MPFAPVLRAAQPITRDEQWLLTQRRPRTSCRPACVLPAYPGLCEGSSTATWLPEDRATSH